LKVANSAKAVVQYEKMGPASGLAAVPSCVFAFEDRFFPMSQNPLSCSQQDSILKLTKSSTLSKCDDTETEDLETKHLRNEVATLRKKVTELSQKLSHLKELHKRGTESRKRMSDCLQELKATPKRTKTISTGSQTKLQAYTSKLRLIFEELQARQNCNKNCAYSEVIREFAYTIYYLSPRAYMRLRNELEKTLPHPNTFNKWTSFVDTSPGLIPSAFNYIRVRTREAPHPVYFTLSIDEMAIRKQIIFDGKKMHGYTDYAGLSVNDKPTKEAKNAFFVQAIEVNGSKSIPICYMLTDGVTTNLIADVVKKCLEELHESGANVLSISFDGLPTNFTAMKKLGACFDIDKEQESLKPYILHPTTEEKVYMMPDASHMFKLIRNNFKKSGIFYNGAGKAIRWTYIERLNEVQDNAGVRAANKLTKRHVCFERQKMKTRLAVQALSNSVKVALDVCRKLNMDGFEDSEATAEFLEICDKLFDLLNSTPKAKGSRSPLRHEALELTEKSSRESWKTFLQKSKRYLLQLKCYTEKGELVHVHTTTRGTFVKGLVTTITSLEFLMDDMSQEKVQLKYEHFCILHES